MKSILRIFPVYLVLLVALASCDTTEPTQPSGDEVKVSVVAIPELVQSFEFREGFDDSLGFRFASTFSLPDRLVGFDSLAVRIRGDWTIGQYGIGYNFGGGAYMDTASMFLWVEALLSTTDSLDLCLETSFRFLAEGEYGVIRDFVGCSGACYPVSDNFIGRELEIELMFNKSSAPWFETITGMPCEVTEVRIEAINPRFLEE